MKKNRVVFYFGGILLLTVVMAIFFERNSRAQTRSISSVTEVLPYFDSHTLPETQKVKQEISLSCNLNEEDVGANLVSSQVIRIKFSDCNHFAKKQALYKIKNLTNGYDGQVFKSLGSNTKGRGPASTSMQLSTDYIQLENGMNIIELEISLNDGQKLNKKIKINRQ